MKRLWAGPTVTLLISSVLISEGELISKGASSDHRTSLTILLSPRCMGEGSCGSLVALVR